MTTLRYDFVVVGLDKINRALASVERRFTQHNNRMDRITGVPTQKRKFVDPNRLEKDTLSRQKRMMNQMERLQIKNANLMSKLAKKQDSEISKQARDRRARFKRELADNVRDMKRNMNDRRNMHVQKQKAEKQAAKLKEREMIKAQKAEEKAGKERIKNQKNALKEIHKNQTAQEKTRMREQKAANTIAARNQKASEMEARRFHNQKARGASNLSNRLTGSVGGGFGYFGRYAGLIAGLSGAAFVGKAVSESARAQKEAVVLSNIAASNPSEQYRSRGSAASSVFKQSKDLSASTGEDKLDIIAALRAITGKSGRLGLGQNLLPTVIDTAQATGSSLTDVGNTVGQILLVLDNFYGNLSDTEALEKTTKIIESMVGQANLGAVEFSDLAGQMSKVLASTNGFTGELDELVALMGAGAQLAQAGGAHDAAEAATAILRFRDDLGKAANKNIFKDPKYKDVRLFKDENKTQLEDPEIILADLFLAGKGNIPEFLKIFGERGRKAAEPFRQVFAKAGGGEAGLRAVEDLKNRFVRARVPVGEISKQAQAVRSTPYQQFQIAAEKTKNALSAELLPALTRLLPKFEKLIPVIGKAADLFSVLIDKFGEDPVGSIVTAFKYKLLADLASASIGTVVSSAITGLILRASLAGSVGGPVAKSVVGAGATALAGRGAMTAAAAGGGAVAGRLASKILTPKNLIRGGLGVGLVLTAADIARELSNLNEETKGSEATRKALEEANSIGQGSGTAEDRLKQIEAMYDAAKKTALGTYDKSIIADGLSGLAGKVTPSGEFELMDLFNGRANKRAAGAALRGLTGLFDSNVKFDQQVELLDAIKSVQEELLNEIKRQNVKPLTERGKEIDELYNRGFSQEMRAMNEPDEFGLPGIGENGMSSIAGTPGYLPGVVTINDLMKSKEDESRITKEATKSLKEFSVSIESINEDLKKFKINRGDRPGDPTRNR